MARAIKILSPILFFFFLAKVSAQSNLITQSNSSPSAFSDPQVMNVILAINDAEVDSAKIAQRRAQNPKVKGFADSMMNVHLANTDETNNLTNKTGSDTQVSSMSSDLQKTAERAKSDLSRASDINFDQLYMAQQIEMHESVLANLREKLIPNTTNLELKSHLDKTLSSVVQHLEMAKSIQSEIRQVR